MAKLSMCADRHRYSLIFLNDRKHARRCVAFLISSDGRLRAHAIFERLRENEKRKLRSHFDNWQAGVINNREYHGWDASAFKGKYTECFVFKGKEGSCRLRLYGFKIHPDVKKPRFELCVLADYAHKTEHEINPSDLKKAEELRTNDRVRESIMRYFGD